MNCDICLQTVQILAIKFIEKYIDKNIGHCGASATQLPLEVTEEPPIVQ